MAESTIAVVAQKLHTWNRTIGVNSVDEEFMLPGEYPLASYSAISGTTSTATANSHILQLMAGGTLNVRVRRIRVNQLALATTVTAMAIQVFRLTTAGTGGTGVTARPFDTSDAAAGAAAMTLPTAKGTEGTLLIEDIYLMRQALLATGAQNSERWEWTQQPGQKPLIIPAGTTNGLAFKNATAVAAGTVTVTMEFVETNF